MGCEVQTKGRQKEQPLTATTLHFLRVNAQTLYLDKQKTKRSRHPLAVSLRTDISVDKNKMRTLIIISFFLSTSLFGQEREFVRNEKIFRYGHLRETNYYIKNGISEAEITWRDSLTSRVVQYSHTFMIVGHRPECKSSECIKYFDNDTTIVIKSKKSGKTIERTYKNNKLIKKKKLSANTGCTECYDPVRVLSK